MSDDNGRRPGFPQVSDPTQVMETARSADLHAPRGTYRIVEGVSALTWFGPLQPIEPAVRPEMAEILGVLGRQYDFPVGYNLRIMPRQEEPLSFEQLRNMREGLDILKLVIETRKDEYAALRYRFVAREGFTATDAEIKEEMIFWESPDRQNNWDEWIRALMDDRFVLDAATIYPRPTKKGQVQKSAKGATYSFELLDGATIKPLIDGRGRLPRPPSIAYQQILKGMPAVEYTTEELVYRPRNVRTNHVYGFPEVEQIAMSVNIALRRELHKLQYYTEGNIPEALIGVPKEWSVEQIMTYQAYWDSILAGNTAERRHAKFVPDGSKYIPTKDAALKSDFDEWLARIVCYCFSVSPAPFVRVMNRATAQTQQQTAQEQGLLPGMRWIANLVNNLLWNYRGKPNLEFSWEEEKSTDPMVQTQIMKIWVDSKIQSPKQCAEALGLDYDPDEFIEPAHITETIQEAAVPPDNGATPPQAAGANGASPEPGAQKEASRGAAEGAGKNEVLPEGQKEPAAAKNVPAKVIKLEKKASASPRERKYRELPPVDRADPAAVKAQKSVANRITSLFKKQRVAFLQQAEAALKKTLKKSDSLRASAPPRDRLLKADADPRIQQIIDQIELEGWAIIPDDLAPYLKQIFAATGAKVIQNLGIASEDSIAAVDDAAVEFASARAAEMVGKKWVDGELVDNPNAAFSIADTTRDQINSIITNAFSGAEETAGWKDIADKIQALTDGSDVFSASRAEMIARTEIGNAQMKGADAGYQQARDMGLELEKKWLDNDSTDECGLNADEGWIPYDDEFPSGDDMPLAHPRCECDLAVRVVEPPEEADVGEPPYK